MSKANSKLVPFTHSKIYDDFTKDVDRVLMKIIHIHLSAVDQIMAKLESKVLMMIKDRRAVDWFLHQSQGPIKNELMLAAIQTEEMARRLRGPAYLLAHAGEAEALARALGKVQVSHAKVKEHKLKDAPSGGSLESRIILYFDRLARKVQDALQLSRTLGDDMTGTEVRVKKAFPKKRKVQSTPALTHRKLKESADGLGQNQLQHIPKMSVGVTDDDMWDDIVTDYESTELPDDIFKRGPTDKTLYYDVTTEETSERYTWEVEQEITEDFVRSVRSGKIDAATENGIEDFMWIAVIDKVTDECCAARDGFSSSEIENMLEDGKLDEDECDAIVAPGHFNCRCKSAPMTDDLPERINIDYGSFSDWLGTKVDE